MTDFEKTNETMKQYPKMFSIAIILIGIVLCVFPPIGIPVIIVGILCLIIFPKIYKSEPPTEFEFPDTDEHGNHRLNIYDLNVTGLLHEHSGIDPQTIIPTLHEGEQILLEADPLNSNDKYAVKVKTMNGIQIGWLPQGANLQIDISNRLNDGQSVYARVKKSYLLDNYPGKVGLVIDVARYTSNDAPSNTPNDILNAVKQEISTPSNKAESPQDHDAFLQEWFQCTTSFPKRDYKGKRALTVREADIYGVGRTYNGTAAQSVINRLNIGDPVILRISSKSDAVKVYNLNDEQFGSLPEWKDLNLPKVKNEVYNSLQQDSTVLACVNSKYNKTNGTVGVIINICRYAAK